MLREYIRKGAQLATEVAFARRRFKLLLKTTLAEINLRVQAVAAATNFFSSTVRPIIIHPPFGKSMLVVGPHQDDEVIGCGGVMALQRRCGRPVQTVVLQDGADECVKVSMTRGALSEVRNEESRAAARLIDAEPPIFLGERDLRANSSRIAASLREVINQRQIDAIFVPFVLDGHPDHRACSAIVAEALDGIGRRIRVLQYEVWANCVPNVVVIVDEVAQMKRAMLDRFEFANSAVDYAHATMGLNMYHSRLVPGRGARYVEAFFETPHEEYIRLIEAVEKAERLARERDGANTRLGK